jgi:Zn-dependent protease with chaperone function
LALFQTLIVTRRFHHSKLSATERESTLRRLSTCHSAVWLSASLAIIWAVRWQDIVRGNWQLDRWPLLDEFLIIAPVIFSLVASWAIFFEIQRSLEPERRLFDWQGLASRMAYVSIRFRVYVVMVLIPISIAILARDLAPWIESLPLGSQAALSLICVLLVTAGFPFLLLVVWKTGRISDERLRTALLQLGNEHMLSIYDVRVWKTGGEIINAVVAGILPGFRVILLSDCLINQFTHKELFAILRHEAGHIKLWHLPIRIGFIVLPLVALAIDEQNPIGILSTLETGLHQLGCPPGSAIGLACAAYVVYLSIALPWLSHQMEFEADIFACHKPSAGGKPKQLDQEYIKDMSDALLRLAAFSPSQLDRKRLLHPSIHRRIEMILAVERSPGEAIKFGKSFVRRRRFILAALVTVCLIAWLR